MLQIYCGDGKGKTTAAAGLSIRMQGSGGSVLFVQFLKGAVSGELSVLEKAGVKVIKCDREYGFWNTLNESERKALLECHNRNLAYAYEHMHEFDMIVLDELCAAYELGAVDREAVRRLCESCKGELVITGRNPDSFFTGRADYISEIKSLRHPFEKGISARKGIEY